MRIVVIGEGKVGYTLAEALSREGHDIIVVDNDTEVLERSESQLDVKVICGNGASVTVQRVAEVGASDLMIAATPSDEVNLLCCMTARKLGCRHTIARIRNPEYTEQVYMLREEMGLSMTVNPEKTAAREIFRLLQFPSFLKRESFAKGRAEIVELTVGEHSRLEGVRLADLYKVLKVNVLVCAVERQNTVYIPDGGFVLKSGDKINVTASAQDLLALVKAIGLHAGKIKSALIVGGSRIAYYLAVMLIESGLKVKVLDIDRERCMELAQSLEKATIVCGDGTSKQTLLSAGIEESDAVVTLTNIDEENMIISMLANNLRVPKVVTKINRTEYIEIFKDKGVDCVVSPKLLTSNDILRYVRAMQNVAGGELVALHRLVEERVEALEFRATAETWYLGVKLRDIAIKKDILIACISHSGVVVIPRGDDCFDLDDSVVVVTTADHSFSTLNDIFVSAPDPVAVRHREPVGERV